jgi:hypothetical protein
MQAERGQHPVQGGVERPGDDAEQVAEQLESIIPAKIV